MAVAAAGTAARTNAAIFASSQQILPVNPVASSSNSSFSIATKCASKFLGAPLRRCHPIKRKMVGSSGTVKAAATVVASPAEEIQEYSLPTWAAFDLGRVPVYWKTMNGLPPMAGEKLKFFYNPAATNLIPNDDFGIAFNASGTDCSFRLQLQVPKQWRNKPIDFFNEGLAGELSKEGACKKAIFPDKNVVVTRCALVGNLSAEGADRCDLNLVLGCTDPSSPLFDPNANVDDGSCPPYSDSED